MAISFAFKAKRISSQVYNLGVMKELDKAIKGERVLVFMDLEGTQFSHEMTQIAAIKVILKDDLTIKKIFKPYKNYVRIKGRVGHVVTKLTGITDELLKKEGLPFRVIQQGLKKYVGKDWCKCRFVTFGSHDAVIVTSSAENNMDASMEEARYLTHHMFDFSEFMSRYVKDENGNPYSLSRALEKFEVKFEGKAHDATNDTKALIALYSAFLSRKDIVAKEYAKNLYRLHHLPAPISKTIMALSEGKSVDPDTFYALINEAIS